MGATKRLQTLLEKEKRGKAGAEEEEEDKKCDGKQETTFREGSRRAGKTCVTLMQFRCMRFDVEDASVNGRVSDLSRNATCRSRSIVPSFRGSSPVASIASDCRVEEFDGGKDDRENSPSRNREREKMRGPSPSFARNGWSVIWHANDDRSIDRSVARSRDRERERERDRKVLLFIQRRIHDASIRVRNRCVRINAQLCGK